MASDLYIYIFFQDNVFVTIVTSIQYWALSDKAANAFYKLSNTRAQIQSYVFDGMDVQLDLEVESHYVSLNNEIKRVMPLLLLKVPWVRIC